MMYAYDDDYLRKATGANQLTWYAPLKFEIILAPLSFPLSLPLKTCQPRVQEGSTFEVLL